MRNFTHIDDIVDGLILVGEKGSGDGYGIGCSEAFTIKEIASMFGGDIEMLPPRKGNRMTAEVIADKTMALGWRAKKNIEQYIKNLKSNNFIDF
jgi:UDP-glucose 4-epimerase